MHAKDEQPYLAYSPQRDITQSFSPCREVWQEAKHHSKQNGMHRKGSESLEERELIYEKLPQDIAERHVLLLVCKLSHAFLPWKRETPPTAVFSYRSVPVFKGVKIPLFLVCKPLQG